MKKYYMVLVTIISLLSISAFGNSCPLENAKYKPLKECVSILLQSVNLAPGCEAQAAALRDASTNLSNIVSSDTTSEENSNKDLLQDSNVAIEQTSSALNSISSINTVLRGRCGKKLMNTFDYMEALTDTVVGLGPLLLLQEGNTSLVLYTAVAGQIIKGLINFLRGKKFDMSKQVTRDQFIKNSCSFYALNNKIRSLLFTLNTREELLDKQLSDTREELQILIEEKPNAPEHQIIESQKRSEKLEKEFIRFKAMLGKISSTQFICLTVKRSINKGFGSDVADLLESLLDGGQDSADIRVFTNYFRSEINNSDLYSGVKCNEQAVNWINSINDLQMITSEIVESKLDKLNKLPSFKKLSTWKKKVSLNKNKIKKIEVNKKTIKEMSTLGHNIDLSEILDNRDSIKLAIFGSESRRAKSAVQSWLIYKIERSHMNLNLFSKKSKEFSRSLKYLNNKDLSSQTREEMCNQAETLLESWTTSESHFKAAKTYCSTFKNVIQKSEFQVSYDYCFTQKEERECKTTSYFDSFDEDDDSEFTISNCSKVKNINSLHAQELELKKHLGTINKLKETLQNLQCSQPSFFTL